MGQYEGTASVDLPYTLESSRLYRALSCEIEARSLISATTTCIAPPIPREKLKTFPFSGDRDLEQLGHPYWTAQHFNLHHSPLFQQATPEEQATILRIASRGLLEEAYFLEKVGADYMAKMGSLSPKMDARLRYTLFNAEEIHHLAQIMPFLPRHKPINSDDPLACFLEKAMETRDRTVLLFVFQVVVKGWGLHRYRTLAKDCQHPELTKILAGFLPDESRHHAIGVTLFRQVSLSFDSRQKIVEILADFLKIVQVWPQSIITAVEQGLGDLSPSQKIQLLENLDVKSDSLSRLALLRSLIGKENAGTILHELDALGAFHPLPAYQ